ncbi:MAG: 5-methyltetrahydropteroyltriglutamate--homocysteine methyltransferase [Planctomycetes bacterium]|nr:5-methyltetrahydropteroyltriglutamate--homocysteine methyltransferase [Planctomycetota bacterium]
MPTGAPGANEPAYAPKLSFDGGELDCGGGLLLLIRQHIDRLEPGELLEIRSRELSVGEDLPAWCRLTANELVSHVRSEKEHRFLVAKGAFDPAKATLAPSATNPAERATAAARESTPQHARIASHAPGTSHTPGTPHAPGAGAAARELAPVFVPASLPPPAPAPTLAPLAVLGIGSWPRPAWLVEALHRRLEGKLDEATFESYADDAVRLAVAAQLRAGVDVVTDGEQRRDSYASFVAGRLANCQLVPIGDLASYVADPEEFARELAALDVPPTVRHPAVFGPLARTRPIAGDEARFVRTLTDRPIKVALPGPYLLTRTMWLECVSDRAYADREALARDVVRVLREELAHLLADGVALVQFDEPVLSEVVFGRARQNRSFMCGALGEKLDVAPELAFAARLLDELGAGFPSERLALHVCRGNWSPDESVALSGGYEPLLELLSGVPMRTLFLELCTPRAGDARVLASLPATKRIGVGVVNQKRPEVESVDAICAHAERLLELVGPTRVLLNPDCGFATFADNPLASSATAEAKLAAIAAAARELRRRHGLG